MCEAAPMMLNMHALQSTNNKQILPFSLLKPFAFALACFCSCRVARGRAWLFVRVCVAFSLCVVCVCFSALGGVVIVTTR
jgi:hypothetical protein